MPSISSLIARIGTLYWSLVLLDSCYYDFVYDDFFFCPQLQNELNALDNSMYEYYQRMGKMKNTIDVLKKNEVSLKNALAECEKKLKDSEDRYRQLRKQAEDEVER